MKSPCTNCKHLIETTEGHRTFQSCDSEELKKGFKYDSFWYHHTCSNQEMLDNCKTCKKLQGIYCTNVYAKCRYVKREEKEE